LQLGDKESAMTLEGHEPGAEETPAPPARTRWSEDAAEDDDVLLPPYVPGARQQPASPSTGAGAGKGPVPPDGSESPREAESIESAPEAGSPDPWAGEEVAQPEPEPAAETVEPEPEPTADPGAGWGPVDYPWEPEATDEAPGGAELMEVESYGDAFGSPDDSLEDDSDLYDAYDLGEGTGSATALPDLGGGYEEPDAPALPALEPAFGEADLHAAAERLERLGDVLRSEGRAGIQRELASRDRLTALLAGVVAGYLAGLQD
jgi:hypothetical protein